MSSDSVADSLATLTDTTKAHACLKSKEDQQARSELAARRSGLERATDAVGVQVARQLQVTRALQYVLQQSVQNKCNALIKETYELKNSGATH